MITCAACEKIIFDRFLVKVLDRCWHSNCVRCFDCRSILNHKCYTRDTKLFCKNDFFRRYGTKCAGCSQGISPQDMVWKTRGDKIFHYNCFTCTICQRQLGTGEELYILDDTKLICKDDYYHHIHQQAKSDYLVSNDEEDEDDVVDNELLESSLHIMGLSPSSSSTTSSSNRRRSSSMMMNNSSSSSSRKPSNKGGGLDGSLDNNNSNHSLNLSHDKDHGGGHGNGNESEGSVDDGDDDDDCDDRDGKGSKDLGGSGGAENISPEDSSNPESKRRGPRTTIKAKQLEILRTAFSQTPKPTRHIRDQLAKETGLSMRVIQVWFQNKRSKERRLKQLTTMGGHRNNLFFNSSRRIRSFPSMYNNPSSLNLMDDDGSLSLNQGHFNYPPYNDVGGGGPPHLPLPPSSSSNERLAAESFHAEYFAQQQAAAAAQASQSHFLPPIPASHLSSRSENGLMNEFVDDEGQQQQQGATNLIHLNNNHHHHPNSSPYHFN